MVDLVDMMIQKINTGRLIKTKSVDIQAINQ